jgi:hypothetical protein
MAIDGIYAAFVTGSVSQGVLFLVFQNGVITGADFGGVMYDGSYIPNMEGDRARLKMTAKVPPGIITIQGKQSSEFGEQFSIECTVPVAGDVPYFRVETPNGPVNVRLQKLRGFGTSGQQ